MLYSRVLSYFIGTTFSVYGSMWHVPFIFVPELPVGTWGVLGENRVGGGNTFNRLLE